MGGWGSFSRGYRYNNKIALIPYDLSHNIIFRNLKPLKCCLLQRTVAQTISIFPQWLAVDTSVSWTQCQCSTMSRDEHYTTLQIDGQHGVSVCWLRVTGIRRVLFIDLAALKMAAPPPPRHSLLQACHLTQLPLALVPSRPPLYSLSCWDDPVGGTPNPIPIPQNMNKWASVQSWTVI